MTKFEAVVRWTPPPPELRLVGEFDLAAVSVFDKALAQVAERSPEELVVDLAGLEFIDSSGLAGLLRARREVPALRLRDVQPTVRRVLEVSGLDHLLDVDGGASA